VNAVLPMLFLASYSYNKIEQIHMQLLLNCHLAGFFVQFVILKSGKMTI